MRRALPYRTADTVDYFAATADGILPLHCVTNHDMEDWRDRVSIKRLDPSYDSAPSIPESHPDMNLVIENNIPLPSKYQNDSLTKEIREALNKLDLGQSFFVPCVDRTMSQLRSLIGSCTPGIPGKHFATRKNPVLPHGIRIWRIE